MQWPFLMETEMASCPLRWGQGHDEELGRNTDGHKLWPGEARVVNASFGGRCGRSSRLLCRR